MTSSLILTLLVSTLTSTTPCPAPTPAPCVTVVINCDHRDADGQPDTCAPTPPPRCPAVTPTPTAVTPEAPPEVMLTRARPAPATPSLEAGATELALFTTARTLPKDTSLVEMSLFAIPEGLPEAWVDVVGVKIGVTDRLQVGFRTSFRLLSVIEGEPVGLIAAGLVGLGFKYQLWRDGEHSLAFNYVFPYAELVWSRHTGNGSLTLAGGTSLLTLAEALDGDDHRDAFVRAGGVWRLSPRIRLIAEAGIGYYFKDPEALVFGTAGLRLGEGRAYLDAFVGLAGEPGDDGGAIVGVALGFQH